MPNPANAAKAGKSGKVQVEATAVSMFPKRFKSHCCAKNGSLETTYSSHLHARYQDKRKQ